MILLLIFTLLQKSVCFPFLKSAEDSQMSHKLFFFFFEVPKQEHHNQS